MSASPWIVVQIGAREHFAVPRALHRTGALSLLLTDRWVDPQGWLCRVPGMGRLGERFHRELRDARVAAPTLRSLAFELLQGSSSRASGWTRTIERNIFMQRWASRRLRRELDGKVHLFAYSYAAAELFELAHGHGWLTVLGQIDPGPVEERIVAEEHRRYPQLVSRWRPAPASYWSHWRRELTLADHIVVNSSWSRQCLRLEGVPDQKLELIPLVFVPPAGSSQQRLSRSGRDLFELLFLGTIGLRKGIARLLDAMKMLDREPIRLILAGPAEIHPSAWEDRANVTWIGPIPRSQVADLYRRADAMILPTLSDGFGITQLEALAYGCPVIASRQCGRAVADGINGWVLPDLEPETIAAMIRHARNAVPHLSQPLPVPSFGLADLASALHSLVSRPNP